MLTLHQKLDRLLAKHDIDDQIPALAAALGIAGVESEVPKRIFIAYVVESIDRAFELKRISDSET